MVLRMPQGSLDFIFFAALGVSFAIALTLWRRPGRGLAFGGAIAGLGWILLCYANEADIAAQFRELNARAARGEKLSSSQQMYDGTGDRVAVLLTGWLPGVVGTAIGCFVAFCLRRFLPHRLPHDHPPLRVVPLESESGPGP